MQLDWPVTALIALVVVLVLAAFWAAARRGAARPNDLRDALEPGLRAETQRLERELRDEVARSAAGTRQELQHSIGVFQHAVLSQHAEVARLQNEQIDGFRSQLATTQQQQAETLRQHTLAQSADASRAREALERALGQLGEQQAVALQRFAEAQADQLRALSRSNDERMAEVRASVETKLAAIQGDNEKKLEQIRATVDEKLHATLEQRLGESFRQVAERLEQVHRGLGEMQSLAKDVGSLSRVLNNVKTRGTLGEVQLGAILEQVFTPEQYARNVETIPGSNARVDFAVRLPTRRDDGRPTWLPIDCKFPREDYERLLDAHERADREGVEAASRAIETRLQDRGARHPRQVRGGAAHRRLRRALRAHRRPVRRSRPAPGSVRGAAPRPSGDARRPDHPDGDAGEVQMHYRTQALAQRSAEVWEVLGAVKTEFGRFGDVLVKTRKKLDEATKTLDHAETRTRQMQRKLREVEALPDDRARPADRSVARRRGSGAGADGPARRRRWRRRRLRPAPARRARCCWR